MGTPIAATAQEDSALPHEIPLTRVRPSRKPPTTLALLGLGVVVIGTGIALTLARNNNSANTSPHASATPTSNARALALADANPAPSQTQPANPATSEHDAATAIPPADNPWVAIVAPSSRGFALGEAGGGTDSSHRFRRGAATFRGSAFEIQRHEVTFSEFEAFSRTNPTHAVRPPAWVPSNAQERAQLPVVNVRWDSALAYCRSLGDHADLPSEEEWEYAARRPDARLDPWGNAQRPAGLHALRDIDGQLAAVESTLGDRTADGVFDMAGNAQEWTGSRFRDNGGGTPAWTSRYRAFRGLPLRERAPARDVPHGGVYRNSGCVGEECEAGDLSAREDVGFRCVRRASGVIDWSAVASAAHQ
jgi:formylglycine-generating enzyme required for sulfatase activity